MTADPVPPTTEPRNATVWVESMLRSFAAYAVPVAVALISLWALWFWPAEYPEESARAPLPFQALTVDDERAPAQALQALALQPVRTVWDTRLSETPLWVLLALPNADVPESPAVDFPSRHVVALRCWNADTLVPLGAFQREGGPSASGALRPSRAGVALVAEPLPQRVLCEARFTGPARFTAKLRSVEELAALERQFHRQAGWIDGGLLLLALFTLIAGLINRERTYLVFAAWLVINMRMAALSGGWDYQWLGHVVPVPWLTPMRQLTLALYSTVTVVLFRFLFDDDLRRTRTLSPVRLVLLACVPVLAAAVVLPYRHFLPLIWTATAIGALVLGYALVVILIRTRSTVAMWYAASMAVTLLASLYEVIAAALGLRGLIGTFDSVTAALASSLLASLAIAEQFRQEHLQRVALQAELQHTFDFLPIGLFTLDPAGRFLSTNPALQTILGRTIEAEREHWETLFPRYEWTQLDAASGSSGTVEFETSLIQDDGIGRRFLVRAARAGDKIEGTLQDITDKVRTHEHLQFLADHDPLTKALNRRGVEACLSRGLQRLRRGKPLAAAYLDLDRFKLINDLYGHVAGDAVLQQVCERVQQPLASHMYLGRVGGDEFLLVMLDTPLHRAETVCRDILTRLASEPYQVGDRAFQVRGSIGLIEVTAGMTAKDVVATADRACREAKRGRSTSLVVYEHGSQAFREHEAEMQLVERLAAGEEIEGLYLEMQPIVSLRHPAQSLNFEVLLRMQDATGSRVPTERLIRAGENAGRMSAIDRWVVAAMLGWLTQHQSQLPTNQFICLNLSGASLNDERFIHDMLEMLERHRDIAHRLCFEVTESVALHDIGNSRRFIDRLRTLGAKVALDDFGAGYTSFSYLKDLPADILKIDGSFIVNMNRHPANVAIVEAIVSLAQNLGMKTIAEWAEDFETVETLAEIGVDFVQGYAVSRPVSADRILAARSGADFISDERISTYLNTLPPDDEFAGVDWVLGAPPSAPAAAKPQSNSMSG
ncbi:putative bifunctional diguanylate cyclase/phosphodiesterase [Tepidimonas charontis]|uniref:Cyclic di-GMP phosphodiesterase PdeB n=1 Tax=Tepidimonas charontis TaxID=2267262 RepID=A0A554X7R2_9BURK|nr:EAL domain-containing protein [Tepidimonas charontis]TSE31868.1 Cyclic di-GMP phosphodiesterase PdeB [Tepidimonas charontis]